ncbi:MAG: ABC transporter substrate-binding protein [Thaumarchaeota archaeon]|nr:ABC transporter substrate-binding protein [Nitrososphaerota archaeon]MDE0525695.1 ABC transporter substrate-binding protein [Nitrososphaerota archaeon]
MKLLRVPTPVVCAVVAAAAVLSIGGVTSDDGLFVSDTSAQTVGGEIKIALLSDFEHKGVFEYAVSEYNREQASITSSNYQITSKVVDVPLGNSSIITYIQDLEREGFKYFIGPLASSSAEAAKAYTDTTNDLVLLSPSSTAASLAIEGDSLFRLVPSDDAQVPIIMDRIQSQGKEHVVLIYRDDTWGVGLHDIITRDYAGAVAHTILLSPDGSNAAAVATEAATQVDRLVSSHGADKVAVLLLSFDTDTVALVQNIISNAALASTLDDVKWYGGDGTAEQRELVDDRDVAAFLSSVDFVSSKFEVVPNPVNLKIGAQAFGDDATYGDNLYDAVFLLADTVIINDEELAEGVSGSTVRSLVLDVAAGLRDHDHRHSERTVGDGALGAYELNAAGDMSSPLTFELFEIFENSNGSFEWRIIKANVCR